VIKPDRVIELRNAAVVRYGGDATSRETDLDCAERSVHAATMASHYINNEERIDPLQVAAYLLYYLALNHCFIDGNKRTAWMACADVLLLHGLEIVASTDEAENLVMRVESKEVDREGVLAWMSRDGRLRGAC
jgi:death on curing protein